MSDERPRERALITRHRVRVWMWAALVSALGWALLSAVLPAQAADSVYRERGDVWRDYRERMRREQAAGVIDRSERLDEVAHAIEEVIEALPRERVEALRPAVEAFETAERGAAGGNGDDGDARGDGTPTVTQAQLNMMLMGLRQMLIPDATDEEMRDLRRRAVEDLRTRLDRIDAFETEAPSPD